MYLPAVHVHSPGATLGGARAVIGEREHRLALELRDAI
jgi:hypothetical protein